MARRELRDEELARAERGVGEQRREGDRAEITVAPLGKHGPYDSHAQSCFHRLITNHLFYLLSATKMSWLALPLRMGSLAAGPSRGGEPGGRRRWLLLRRRGYGGRRRKGGGRRRQVSQIPSSPTGSILGIIRRGHEVEFLLLNLLTGSESKRGGSQGKGPATPRQRPSKRRRME